VDAANVLDAGSPDVAQLGESLFTTYLFAFEVTSVLLVIAVVGAVVLSRKVKRADYVDDPLVSAAAIAVSAPADDADEAES
jgi:NADH-quinone oxidoreductase subunit J